MALEALNSPAPEEGVNAAFMRNHHGKVCIAFSDPVYVRADSILVDSKNLAIHALLHENSFLLGHVSEGMMKAFVENKEALLTAIRPDGSILELAAPIEISHDA